jgi:hypothetical protein
MSENNLELLKYIDANIGSTPYSEAADDRYSWICKCEVEQQLGAGTEHQIGSMRILNVYVFAIEILRKSRSIVQRLGGGLGDGGVDVESIDIWSDIDMNKWGDFDIGIEGSTIKETCHVCNGSKKCSRCGGTKRVKCSCRGFDRECNKCGGTGEALCDVCDGTGKCKECGGSGEAEYSLWRIQKEHKLEGCHAIAREVAENLIPLPTIDGCDDVRMLADIKAFGKVIYSVDEALNDKLDDCRLLPEDIIRNIVSGDRFRYCESIKLYGRGENGRDVEGCPNDVFSFMVADLKQNADRDPLRGRVGYFNSFGKLRSDKVFLRCTITKIPIGVECGVLISGGKGRVAVAAENRLPFIDGYVLYTDWPQKIEKHLNRLKVANANKYAVYEFRLFDYYLAATLVVATAVIAVPLFWGNYVLEEYLSKVFSPACIVGCALFLCIDILVWYFGMYVACLAHRVPRREVCGYWEREICYDWEDWRNRSVRLLWVLVPFTVVQMLDANVPHVSQVLQPAKEWFACISNPEWAYISGICAVKFGIVAFAIRRGWPWRYVRGWNVIVEKSAVVLLAGLSLALLIWPTYLADGVALKSISAQVLSYVSLPVYCVGYVVFWTVWLALLVAGYVCRMTGLLIWWIVSMLFWCISSFFS